MDCIRNQTAPMMISLTLLPTPCCLPPPRTARPAKLCEGLPHPDPIVETQSLAGVMAPDITYTHHLEVCRGGVFQHISTVYDKPAVPHVMKYKFTTFRHACMPTLKHIISMAQGHLQCK